MVATIAAVLIAIAIVLLMGRQTTASFCNQSDSTAQTGRFGTVDASADCAHLG